jgi:uncharacterized phiE125 gp8 family phage protein
MSLTLITAPVAKPLIPSEVGDHIRADLTAEYMLVDVYISAITAKAESYIKRALITQTWELALDHFPCVPQAIINTGRFGGIRLPMSPVQAIDSIVFIDGNGEPQTLDPAEYYKTDDDPAVVVPIYGNTWPATRVQPGAVKIRYTCGYGNESTDIPEAIRVWMLINIANLYENRESVIVGKTGVVELSTMADSLLDSYRLVQF